MNKQTDDLTFLTNTLISHFYFENIHPFSDGNGRIGRIIIENQLKFFVSSFNFDELTNAYIFTSLTRGIKRNTKLYYESFKNAQKIKNKGELTFFVKSMLTIINEQLKEDLKGFKYVC